MKKLCLLPAALFCAFCSTLTVFADELPYYTPAVRRADVSLLPVLVAGLLVIAAAASVWYYLQNKKKR